MCNEFTFHHQFGIDTVRAKLSNRQTVFFLLVDPMDKNHKDPCTIDLNAPRHPQYMHKAWKKHQNTVYWVDINFAIAKGLKFFQTRSSAIILQETIPAYCIPQVVRMETGKSHSTGRGTRPVRRNNECARVWLIARTLRAARWPCGPVAIWRKSRGFFPEHDVKLLFVECLCCNISVSSVLYQRVFPGLALSRTGRRCHIRQWRFWCRFCQQFRCSPSSVMICCFCPQSTVSTRSR